MPDVETSFEIELREKMLRAQKECKYNPTRFLQMLAQYGSIDTAKRLIRTGIATGRPSDGYVTLYTLNRLDLSMENSVVKPDYMALFTSEEIAYCKSLLEQSGY